MLIFHDMVMNAESLLFSLRKLDLDAAGTLHLTGVPLKSFLRRLLDGRLVSTALYSADAFEVLATDSLCVPAFSTRFVF